MHWPNSWTHWPNTTGDAARFAPFVLLLAALAFLTTIGALTILQDLLQ